MKFVLISREFEPFYGGGIGSYTERYARALADEGHRAIVVTVSSDGLPMREERAGVTILRLPFIDGTNWGGPHPRLDTPEHRAAFETFSPVSVFSMQVARALPGLIEAERPDIIEAPECGALGWFALNQRRLGRGLGFGRAAPGVIEPPFIVHLHSPSAWIEAWNRDPGPPGTGGRLRAMERDCARWADALVSPSEAMANWAIAEWVVDAPFRCPYPLGGLELEARDAARRPRSLRPRAHRLLFIGRLEARKGVDTLLAAFALAARRDPDLRLDLAGSDTRDRRSGMLFGERALELLVPADLRPRITAYGSLAPARLAELAASADACVFPAPMDNFPYACMEAMARGSLVIAARSGGLSEMIRDAADGVLFEPSNAEACAAAIEAAIALPPARRASLGTSAARRILAIASNGTVIRRRISHARRVIEFHRARGVRLADPARAVIVAEEDRPSPPSAFRRKLAASLSPGLGFAHGWVESDEAGVRAFTTPDVEALDGTEAPIGPLALDPRLLAGPRIASLVEPRPDGTWRTRSTLELARILAGMGVPGAVVPDIRAEAPGPPTMPEAGVPG